jgi:hypothetical protein
MPRPDPEGSHPTSRLEPEGITAANSSGGNPRRLRQDGALTKVGDTREIDARLDLLPPGSEEWSALVDARKALIAHTGEGVLGWSLKEGTRATDTRLARRRPLTQPRGPSDRAYDELSLQANLAHARLAVIYVMAQMKVGAANKARDLARSIGGSVLCVMASRSVNIGMTRQDPIPKWIRERAAVAERAECGNCGEQAAIAFMFLHEHLRARPLDYMARTNRDHAFVVVGRIRHSRAGDYTTWGTDAAVCDPWDNKSYAATDIPTQACGGARPFGVASLFRLA